MSRTEIISCDRCGVEEKRMNGIQIVLGFSEGGWGRRDNQVYWSGEVCDKCYKEYRSFTPKIKDWLIQKGTVKDIFNNEPVSKLGIGGFGPDAIFKVPKPKFFTRERDIK